MVSIRQRLENPTARCGAPSAAYITEARLQPVGRWKRTRQWAKQGSADALILPWIVLNPAGNTIAADEDTAQSLSTSGASWTMVVLSWRWGFDGFTAYNVFPYEAKRPKDIPRLVRELGTEAVSRSHELIAADLRGTDAIVCAWGRERFAKSPSGELLKRLEVDRAVPVAHFCLGLTVNGSPRHPLYQPHDLEPVPYGGWRDRPV